MVDRDELRRRWAPTLDQATASEESPSHGFTAVNPEANVTRGVQPHEAARAFVATVGGRTLISAPATVETAGRMPTVADITKQHLLWMHGRFVGADSPNRNQAMWSAGDLEMAQASVTHGPLNWLHEERHVIGSIAKAQYVGAELVRAATEPDQPYIAATAAVWRWIWPDEAYVIEQASEAGKLWYSMECISEAVECAGDSGCGAATSYEQYLAGAACEHLRQKASVRRFVNPVFLGGAVIVPPVEPGWSQADASVMKEAAAMAEDTFNQAGQPDIQTSEWERLMAGVITFART